MKPHNIAKSEEFKYFVMRKKMHNAILVYIYIYAYKLFCLACAKCLIENKLSSNNFT